MAVNRALKDVYQNIQMFKELCAELGDPKGGRDCIAEFMKEQRRKIRKLNQYSVDPLEKSMQEEWRHGGSEDGEDGYDYCILPDNGETEEDIETMVEDAIGYGPICGPYDCTGKRFTKWIKVRRVPAGFAVIHSWGLDV